MIIDVHTHAYPEKVADKARASHEESFKMKVVTEPTVPALLAFMDKNGIDVSVICGVATRPDLVVPINDWLFSVRSERIRVFAALHPAFEGREAEIDRISRHADGIKFQPEFQDFFVDDEKLSPMYERIVERKLPVLFHCGEELSGTKVVHATPERMARLNDRFPRMTVIAGHYGGYLMWDQVREHLLGRDIYLETSDLFGYRSVPETIALLKGHRPDRILFGTDFPLVDQAKDITYLRELDIPEGLKEAVFSGNAARLLGIKQDRRIT
ncbi:MAG: amidohydrolase family protein [Deltaproteobacteria bacterium]